MKTITNNNNAFCNSVAFKNSKKNEENIIVIPNNSSINKSQNRNYGYDVAPNYFANINYVEHKPTEIEIRNKKLEEKYGRKKICR